MNVPVLLVFINSSPQIQIVDDFPRSSFRRFNYCFDEIVLGRSGEVGFIDWLRSYSGRVLGIRLWLHRDWFGLIEYFSESPQVRMEGEGIFEIVIQEGTINAELSCDQAFDETRAYVSPEGSLVLALSVAALSDLEVDDILHQLHV